MVAGFTAWLVLPVLAAKGIPLEARTGIMAAGGLPWIAKAVLSPGLDRYRRVRGGDPRLAIAASLFAVAVCIAGIASTGDVVEHTGLLTAMWLLQNTALALSDAATDTLAIDLLQPAERGRGNALMLGAREVGGLVITGMGLVAVYARSGLTAALWVEAGLVALLAPLPFLVGAAHPSGPERTEPPLLPSLRAALASSASRRGLAVACVLLLGAQVTSAVSDSLLIERLGWTPERKATLTTPYLITTLGAYAAMAAIADRVGPRRLAAAGTLGVGLTWIGFALLEAHWGSQGVIVCEVVIESVFTAALFAGIHAYFMGLVDPAVRATQFVVFMAALNLPRAYGPLIAPQLLQTLDFAGLYGVLGLFQAALVWPLWRRSPAEAPGG